MKRIVFALALVMPLLVLGSLVMAISGQPPVETSAAAAVTVNEFLDITITDSGTAGFSFGSQDPGTTRNSEVDQVEGAASTIPAVNIKSETTSNIDAYIRLKGDDFTGAGTITVDPNVVYDDDGAVDESTDTGSYAQTTLTTTYPASAYATLTPGSDVDIWYWMDIPSGQTAGSYSSTFYFQGASS